MPNGIVLETITAFKRTPDFQSGGELNAEVERERKSSFAYMSSSSGGNPALKGGEDVIFKENIGGREAIFL